jgi:hypothetical protein
VLANYSDEQLKSAKVKLSIDDKDVISTSVAFATGQVARADLPLPPLSPGWHSAVARVESKDALALDNVRYEALFVPQPLRTLLVETRQGKRVFEEETFFVSSALDPMQGEMSSNAPPPRFAIEKVSFEQLLKKISPQPAPSKYDLILLPGLRQIPPGLAGALLEFVRGGGGLVFFLNDDVSRERYNTEFRDLLPAQIGPLERSRSGPLDSKWHLEDYDRKAPMFMAFRRPGSGNLALPEFTRRCALTANPGSTLSASFEDGAPAIVSQEVGQGQVVLIDTTADTAWTDWPKHKTFVPWLHGLCFSLCALSLAQQSRSASHLVAAEDNEIILGSALKQQTVRVRQPGNKEITTVADADGRLTNLDFSLPGVYAISDKAGQELQRVVVNPPAEESDLTSLTPADFERDLVRTPDSPNVTLAAGLFGSEPQQKEFARFFLVAALVLLFGETFLANRTYQ